MKRDVFPVMLKSWLKKISLVSYPECRPKLNTERSHLAESLCPVSPICRFTLPLKPCWINYLKERRLLSCQDLSSFNSQSINWGFAFHSTTAIRYG